MKAVMPCCLANSHEHLCSFNLQDLAVQEKHSNPLGLLDPEGGSSTLKRQYLPFVEA
jgi:hypothetical protein